MPFMELAEDITYGNSSAYGNSTSLNETGSSDLELFDLINYNIGTYNQNPDLAPSVLKSLAGDGDILFAITLENGGEMYAWSYRKCGVVEFEKLEISNVIDIHQQSAEMNELFIQLLNLLLLLRSSTGL
jgi:hypothetical protein